MHRLTMTSYQVAKAMGEGLYPKSVHLVGQPGDWAICIWIEAEGRIASFGLASARDPAMVRVFKTADAAIRQLHALGLRDININWC